MITKMQVSVVTPLNFGVGDEVACRAVRAAGTNEELEPIDPVRFQGWDELISKHPESSIFHGTGWARVLQETYGHKAVYFCRSEAGSVTALLPVMEIASRWTGRKGVSLPFTDFCSPILNGKRTDLFSAAMRHGRQHGWKYFECRGAKNDWPGASESKSFWGHSIDLRRGPEEMLHGVKSSVRRGIRKAQREGLKIQFSGSAEAMQIYYKLHCLTRQRHGRPCQPWEFFENIQRFLLERDHGFVGTAWWKEHPIAAAVYLSHGRQAIFKFGASDYSFQRLRPNNLLMWESIKHCAARGAEVLHLGRTSLSNEGLRRFKLGFGATEERIDYSRYNFRKKTFVRSIDCAEGFNHVLSWLHPSVLKLAGRILYPHLS